jgi:hypothetical protein
MEENREREGLLIQQLPADPACTSRTMPLHLGGHGRGLKNFYTIHLKIWLSSVHGDSEA